MTHATPKQQTRTGLWRLVQAGALTGIILLALALRVYRIEDQSVWTDDFFSIGYLGAPDLGTYVGLVASANEEHVPVYYAGQYLWAELFGPSAIRVRMLSIVFGLLTIPLVYGLARRIFSPGAGLLAALFFAVSPMHIFHNQGLRPYALLVLLAGLSVYSLYEAATRRQKRWWLIHFTANFLLVWTHLFGLFLVAAEGVWVLWAFMHNRRRLGLWAGMHAVLLSPTLWWIWVMPRMAAETYTGYFNAPGWREVLFDLVGEDAIELNGELLTTQQTWPVLGERAGAFLFQLHPVYDSILVFFFAACVVWAVWRAVQAWRAKDSGTGRGLALLLAVFFLPVLALAVLSYVWRPCIFPRYTLYGSLALYVIAGSALMRVPHRGLRGALLILVLCTYAYQLSFLLPANVRTDWIGVARQIETRGEAGDLVLVSARPGPALGAYHFALFNGVGTEAMHVIPAHTRQAVLGKSAGYLHRHRANAVWVVIQHDYGLTRPAELEAALVRAGLQFQHTALPGMENLSLYCVQMGLSAKGNASTPVLQSETDYKSLLARCGMKHRSPERRKRALEKLRWVRERPIPEENPWHLALVARLLVDEGDPELTLAAAETALEINRFWLIAHLARAVALLQLKEYAAAEDAFEEFRALNPRYGRVLAPLMEALFAPGKREKARREAERLQDMPALRLPQALFAECGAARNRYYVFDGPPAGGSQAQ